MMDRLKLKPAFLRRPATLHNMNNGSTQDRVKVKIAPSHYPQLPFRILQILQLACALAVMAIMSWFIYHLRDSSLAVPWRFIFLLTISILTPLSLLATTLQGGLYHLPPALQNALQNTTLLILWALAFALLATAMQWPTTMGHACSLADWDTDRGMAVCRTYQALFAVALAELPVTLLALALDLVVRRQETGLGVYGRTGGGYGEDPYGEAKGLVVPSLSPRGVAAGYGLVRRGGGGRDEKMGGSPGLMGSPGSLRSPGEGEGEGGQEGQMEMELEPLREVELRGLGMTHRTPSLEGERRYDDDEGEDIGYHRRSGGESVHDMLRA